MMHTNSAQSKWREIYERQQLANAKRWLNLLAAEENSMEIVIQEYDNLLRALEITLQKKETFDIAYQLIEQLFPNVLGYGDWERWLVYLQEALNMSQKLKRVGKEANIIRFMGNIYTFKGDYQRAYDLYSQCKKKYSQLNDNVNYADTLTKLAAVHDSQGNTKESLQLLEEAVLVSNSINNPKVLMQINLFLSSAYHKSRDWLSGLSAAESAYELAGQLGDSQLEKLALLNIVAIRAELGHWREVDRLSEKIQETLMASGDLIRLSILKNTMGIAAFNQGHYYVAEKAWQDALQINSQVNQPVELARIYNNLGMVYTKLGELETAVDMLNRAAAIFHEKGDLFNWANTLDNLADVYKIQGDDVEYRETLKLALSQLPENSPEPHIQDLYSIINGRLAASD